MQRAQSSSPLFFIAQALIGYGVWFLTVPAVILQLFGVCIAVITILGLVLSWRPDLSALLFSSLASAFPDLHVSARISLVQPFLIAYTVFCFVMSVVELILEWKFHIQWKWTVKRALLTLLGLAATTYGSTALLALTLQKDILAPFLFFIITSVASIVAILAHAIGTKIVNLFR